MVKFFVIWHVTWEGERQRERERERERERDRERETGREREKQDRQRTNNVNIEARWCNHSCCGKSITVTYSKCVCV